MSQADWFRRTTWTEQDRAEFDARLRRARGESSKAQYLRIQSVHLAEVGLHREAVELLNRLLSEFPIQLELAMAHKLKAESLGEMGQIEDAVREFRNAMQVDDEVPNVRSGAWLEFAWFVATRELISLYGEASHQLDRHREDAGLRLPLREFKEWTARALIAHYRGESTAAREAARRALDEAERSHSGLRYHSTVGLVGELREVVEERLRSIAGLK